MKVRKYESARCKYRECPECHREFSYDDTAYEVELEVIHTVMCYSCLKKLLLLSSCAMDLLNKLIK